MIIVGHTSPDWDCITAIWLLMRFGGMEAADVRFVNTGAPDQVVLAQADAVVDTGREYDPARLRFDHHHLHGRAASETCAAAMVFDHLTGGDYQHALFYLNQIVALVLAGDTGKKTDGADWSRIEGVHAMLSALKARGAADYTLLNYGMGWLDLIAEHSKARYEAQSTLALYSVYRSDDGLLVALKEAPIHATSAAFDAGARLVLFQSSSEATNAIGIQRASEWQEPHCDGLVSSLLNDYDCGLDDISTATYSELATWYRHQAGFFAGRGTMKAPDPRPILADLADIARAIDAAWQRS